MAPIVPKYGWVTLKDRVRHMIVKKEGENLTFLCGATGKADDVKNLPHKMHCAACQAKSLARRG
jgi:hypothetical protein